jgi:hypothetical protein
MYICLCTYVFCAYVHTGPSQVGGLGGLWPPQFLAKQLTLSQPGGQIMPTTVLQAPPDFQTLRRPWHIVLGKLKSGKWDCSVIILYEERPPFSNNRGGGRSKHQGGRIVIDYIFLYTLLLFSFLFLPNLGGGAIAPLFPTSA